VKRRRPGRPRLRGLHPVPRHVRRRQVPLRGGVGAARAAPGSGLRLRAVLRGDPTGPRHRV